MFLLFAVCCPIAAPTALARMHVVNCHQNTEAADLLGGLRPVRGRELLVQDLRDRAKVFVARCESVAGGHGLGGDDAMDDDFAGAASSPLDTADVAGLTAAVQVRGSAVWISLPCLDARRSSMLMLILGTSVTWEPSNHPSIHRSIDRISGAVLAFVVSIPLLFRAEFSHALYYGVESKRV